MMLKFRKSQFFTEGSSLPSFSGKYKIILHIKSSAMSLENSGSLM